MKSKPILFKGEMVRAILNGSKTQTRRIVKPQPIQDARFVGGWKVIGKGGEESATCSPLIADKSPYGQPGDQLWVRETFQPTFAPDIERNDTDWETGKGYQIRYSATDDRVDWMDGDDNITRRCKPAIHMPRWASRITLGITGVRVELLQDISEADAVAEGIESLTYSDLTTYRNYALNDEWAAVSPMLESPIDSYRTLWESINGSGSWDANPWVWVVEFKRVTG